MFTATGEELNSYFEQFRDNFRDTIKESGSGLRNYFDVESGFRGEAARPVGFVDVPDARFNNDPAGETPIMGHSLTDRWLYPEEWEWGDLITRREVMEAMADPTSKIFKAAMKSMMRFEKFQIAIPAFFGDARYGKRGNQVASFDTRVFTPAVTDGRQIDIELGDGAAETGMNEDKLLKIFEIFYHLEVLLDDAEDDQQIYVGLSAKQNTEIINFAKVNADKHIEKPVIEKGKVVSWMGLNFVHSTRWPKTGTTRLLPAWIKDGMYQGVWEDINGWMKPNTNRKGNPHIYMSSRGGAVRLDEKKVLQIPCKE